MSNINFMLKVSHVLLTALRMLSNASKLWKVDWVLGFSEFIKFLQKFFYNMLHNSNRCMLAICTVSKTRIVLGLLLMADIPQYSQTFGRHLSSCHLFYICHCICTLISWCECLISAFWCISQILRTLVSPNNPQQTTAFAQKVINQCGKCNDMKN